MIVLSPVLMILIILSTILTVFYLPIDRIRYNKYQELGKYELLFTIRKRKEIKELKKEMSQI